MFPWRFLCCVFHLLWCHGQDLHMTVDPDSFLPSVTSKVTVTCTVTSVGASPPTLLLIQLGRQTLIHAQEGEAEAAQGGASQAENREATIPDNSEELLVSVTPGSNATLNDQAATDGMAAEGKINSMSSGLTLTLTSLRPSDAGRYLCHASLLSHDFRMHQLNASVNLSIIAVEQSASLLLAREQMLESQQRQLQQNETATLQELGKVKSAQQQLLDMVHNLQIKNDNLTVFVQELQTVVTELRSSVSRAGAIQDTSLTDNVQILNEELTDVRDSIGKVQDVLLPSMTARLDHVENVTSALAKTLSGVTGHSHLQGDSDHKENGENTEELQEVLGKIERMDKDRGQLADHVATLEKMALPEVKSRLDDLEQTTLRLVVQKINALTEQQARQTEIVQQLQSHYERLTAGDGNSDVTVINPDRQGDPGTDSGHVSDTSATAIVDSGSETLGSPSNQDAALVPSLISPGANPKVNVGPQGDGRQCYVCGDEGQSQPCSLQELRAATTQPCPAGADLCLNTIVQELTARHIYKRCAGPTECQQLQNVSASAQCATFSFMSRGQFTCHFCCDSDRCNLNFKPSPDLP